jgi:hypothetical protein
MTDEQLAVLTQQNDDDAFRELFNRYEGAMEYRSQTAAKQYPYYADEFFSYMQDRFHQAILKFDPERKVDVAAFMGALFPRFINDFVRYKINKRVIGEDGVKRKTSEVTNRVKHLSVPVEDSKLSSRTDNTFTFEYQRDFEETEVFQYLQTKDDTYAKVISLLVQGYGWIEIGKLVGKKETDKAAKSWVQRQMDKIRQETVIFYQESDSFNEVMGYI